MPNLNISAKDVQGLLPSLDRRVIDKPFVLEGENFSFSFEGPHAAFGSAIVSPYKLQNPQGFATFDIDGIGFIFINSGVYLLDFDSKVFVPQFFFTGLAGVAPWSHAFVGSKHYLCREGLGLLRYDPATFVWTVITTDVPTGAKSVCKSNGRLVILGDTVYAWSALDDGTDLAPSLTTGAGFQQTSILGGTPYSCGAYNGGVFVYTSSGVIRAHFIGGSAIFRHRPFTREVRLLNKFGMLVRDDEHIVITELGLFRSEGNKFEEFQPLMNEHLRSLIINFTPARDDAIRLFYNRNEELLFVSVSFVDGSNFFNEAFVLKRKRDRWGQLNHSHYGLGDFFFDSGAEQGFHFGYISQDADLHWFDNSLHKEDEPFTDNQGADLHQHEIQFPTFIGTSGVITCASVGIGAAFDESVFASLYTVGYYNTTTLAVNSGNLLLEDGASTLLLEDGASFLLLEQDTTTVITQLDSNFLNMDSRSVIGSFRFTEQQYPDELGMVTNVAVGAGELPVGQIVEDWNILTGNEDWNLLDGEEDWGSGISASEVFSAKFESYDDAYHVLSNQSIVMDDFVYDNDGSTLYYGIYNIGVQHSLELSTTTAGESFHLKFLEISGNLAGRIAGHTS